MQVLNVVCFYKKIEGLDCVSLGPDMKDIHTSEEVLDIASTERVWNYLVKVLEAVKRLSLSSQNSIINSITQKGFCTMMRSLFCI